MIQSIPTARAAAESAGSAMPTPARVSQGGKPVEGRQVTERAVHAFGERMRLASRETEARSTEPPAVWMPDAPAALPTEQGQVLRLGGDAAQGAEAARELTPEQWLLSMIDQQLAEIQARDAAQLEAVPEPVAPASVEAAAPLIDELLAWIPGSSPLGEQESEADQALTADPLDLLGGFHGKTSGASLTASPMPKPAAEMAPGLSTPALTDVLPTASLEPLLNATESLDAGEPLAGAVERGQAPLVQGADRGLKLQAPEAKWGEQMLHALRENVDLQIQQKIQSATIRLDPPELGSMEILLSHESGRLNVQLSAANADVARLLQQTSDRLRQELVGQHFVQVNVQVGADSGGQQGRRDQRATLPGEEPPLAARPAEQEQRRENGRARDVLITV